MSSTEESCQLKAGHPPAGLGLFITFVCKQGV